MTSSPRPPTITSLPGVPTSVSPRSVPVIVAGAPSQLGPFARTVADTAGAVSIALQMYDASPMPPATATSAPADFQLIESVAPGAAVGVIVVPECPDPNANPNVLTASPSWSSNVMFDPNRFGGSK